MSAAMGHTESMESTWGCQRVETSMQSLVLNCELSGGEQTS